MYLPYLLYPSCKARYSGNACRRVSSPNGRSSMPMTKAIDVSATGVPID